MKITVVGVGGVGGYFGGKLARKFDVTFIARGKTLEALTTKGLTVESVDGDFHVDVKATEEYEPTDLIIIATKAPHLRQVAEEMIPAIKESTLILPLLNGVDAVTYLQSKFGKKVIGGFCRIISYKVEPGHIKNTGGMGSISLGEIEGSISERVRRLADLLISADIRVSLEEDFLVAQWTKMTLICSTSAIGALSRSTFGQIRAVPETWNLLMSSMQEVVAVAQHQGVEIDESVIPPLLDFVKTLPEDGTTSMHRDIVSGSPSELDYLIGSIVNLGKNLDIPLSRFLYYCLLPQELATRNEVV